MESMSHVKLGLLLILWYLKKNWNSLQMTFCIAVCKHCLAYISKLRNIFRVVGCQEGRLSKNSQVCRDTLVYILGSSMNLFSVFAIEKKL